MTREEHLSRTLFAIGLIPLFELRRAGVIAAAIAAGVALATASVLGLLVTSRCEGRRRSRSSCGGWFAGRCRRR